MSRSGERPDHHVVSQPSGAGVLCLAAWRTASGIGGHPREPIGEGDGSPSPIGSRIAGALTMADPAGDERAARIAIVATGPPKPGVGRRPCERGPSPIGAGRRIVARGRRPATRRRHGRLDHALPGLRGLLHHEALAAPSPSQDRPVRTSTVASRSPRGMTTRRRSSSSRGCSGRTGPDDRERPPRSVAVAILTSHGAPDIFLPFHVRICPLQIRTTIGQKMSGRGLTTVCRVAAIRAVRPAAPPP
jgi:hypothetical protein